jgi:hypothetical protein
MSLALFTGLISFCVAGTFLTQGFTWPIYILLALTTAMAKYAQDYEPAEIVQPAPVRTDLFNTGRLA